MKNIFALSVLFLFTIYSKAGSPDSSATTPVSVLVIPYNPSMHLSDADMDISEGSEMEMPQMRATLRQGLIKQLNKNFEELYDVKGMSNDFVMDDNKDVNAIYHSVYYERDSVYPLKYPKRFAIKDTVPQKKGSVKLKPESQYINTGIYDQSLIPDLSEKHNADYIIFLNEIDIHTHFDDCINLALKIYRRDLKVHYTIFDKNGKQVYGDVAVSHFGSNSNDVNDIMSKNFPGIADYILASLNKVAR